MRNLLASLVVITSLAGAPVSAPDEAGKSISHELEAMLAKDQEGRAEINEAMKRFAPDSPEVGKLWFEQDRRDKENFARLEAMIEADGWPKRSVVGEKAATAVFLILQHAPHEAQVRYLPLFREAVRTGEASKSQLALLEDRVLLQSGKKQLYGSQLVDHGDGLVFHPIEDEANVDRRRAEMGLEPIAEYAKSFGIEYVPGED